MEKFSDISIVTDQITFSFLQWEFLEVQTTMISENSCLVT